MGVLQALFGPLGLPEEINLSAPLWINSLGSYGRQSWLQIGMFSGRPFGLIIVSQPLVGLSDHFF